MSACETSTWAQLHSLKPVALDSHSCHDFAHIAGGLIAGYLVIWPDIWPCRLISGYMAKYLVKWPEIWSHSRISRQLARNPTIWPDIRLFGHCFVFAELDGIPWNSKDYHQILTDFMEARCIPWKSMEFHGVPWGPMEFHGFPWSSID